MKKILLIDDVKDNLRAAKEALEDLIPDCQVITTRSGKEGVKLAKEEQPDTIISDIIMPEMDGIEVCKRLREDEATKYIPIIIHTGSKTDTETRIQCLEAGADVFLAKPIDPGELIAQINAMLRIKEIEDKLRDDKKLSDESILNRTKELRESEEKYRDLVEKGNIAIAVDDENGKLVYYNNKFLNLFGYTAAEMKNKTHELLIHPEDFKVVSQYHKDRLQRIETQSRYEFRGIRKDGSIIYLEIEVSQVLGKEGNLASTRSYLWNITERKKAEDALVESEQLNRAVIEHSPIGISIRDKNGTLLLSNNAWQKLWGLSDNEVSEYHKPRNKLTFDDKDSYLGEHLDNINKVYKTGGEYYIPSLRLLDYNKSKTCWISQHFYAIKDDERNVQRVVILTEDITKRKQAEEALRESEDKYHLLVENAPTVLWKTNEKGHTVFISSNIKEVFGFTPEKFYTDKNKWFERIYHDDLHKVKTNFHELFGKNKKFNVEYRIKRKDGKWIWLNDISNVVHEEKGERYAYGVFIDITEHKQAEKELRESEERYRSLITNLPVGIFRSSLDGKMISANSAMADIYGYDSVDELLRVPAKDYYTEKDSREKMLSELEKQGILLDYNTQEKKKDGFLIWVSTNYKKVWSEEDKRYYIDGVVADVTERKQAEEIQKTLYNISNALNVVDNLHELFIKIREYLGDVIDATNFYVALYDEKTDMISLPFNVDEKNDSETFPAGKTLTKYVIMSGKPLLATNDVIEELTKKGIVETIGAYSEIWLGVPLKINNQVIGVIVVQSYEDPNLYSEKDIEILTFISEEIALAIQHKQAEEELKINRERLRTANSILRHDITNDIVVIKSALDIYRDEDDETMLDEIEKRVEKSINTINKQREQEKFIDSHSDLDEFEIEKVVHDIIPNFSDIKINVTGKGTAYADNAIYSVFENIIDNAVKHGHTTKMDINIRSDEEYCEIRFADYGTGIPDDLKYKIFDEGFSYGKAGHTGIGLYIVQKTIDDYDGFVHVEDNKPNGAVFVVRLRRVIER